MSGEWHPRQEAAACIGGRAQSRRNGCVYNRCVIDRRVYAASLSDAVALLLPSLYNDACDRELGHVLRLTHMHVTLRCDRTRGESSRCRSSLVRMHRPRPRSAAALFRYRSMRRFRKEGKKIYFRMSFFFFLVEDRRFFLTRRWKIFNRNKNIKSERMNGLNRN